MESVIDDLSIWIETYAVWDVGGVALFRFVQRLVTWEFNFCSRKSELPPPCSAAFVFLLLPMFGGVAIFKCSTPLRPECYCC